MIIEKKTYAGQVHATDHTRAKKALLQIIKGVTAAGVGVKSREKNDRYEVDFYLDGVRYYLRMTQVGMYPIESAPLKIGFRPTEHSRTAQVVQRKSGFDVPKIVALIVAQLGQEKGRLKEREERSRVESVNRGIARSLYAELKLEQGDRIHIHGSGPIRKAWWT